MFNIKNTSKINLSVLVSIKIDTNILEKDTMFAHIWATLHYFTDKRPEGTSIMLTWVWYSTGNVLVATSLHLRYLRKMSWKGSAQC